MRERKRWQTSTFTLSPELLVDTPERRELARLLIQTATSQGRRRRGLVNCASRGAEMRNIEDAHAVFRLVLRAIYDAGRPVVANASNTREDDA